MKIVRDNVNFVFMKFKYLNTIYFYKCLDL